MPDHARHHVPYHTIPHTRNWSYTQPLGEWALTPSLGPVGPRECGEPAIGFRAMTCVKDTIRHPWLPHNATPRHPGLSNIPHCPNQNQNKYQLVPVEYTPHSTRYRSCITCCIPQHTLHHTPYYPETHCLKLWNTPWINVILDDMSECCPKTYRSHVQQRECPGHRTGGILCPASGHWASGH